MDTKEQNVSWNDQTTGYTHTVASSYDDTRTNTDANDADLGGFFERPLKIHTFEWSPSVTCYEFIDPWTLYLENPRVINRLNNFNLLKGKLHVKIMINGNAFYYGRLLANYIPRYLSDDLVQDRALIKADNVQASQRPHIFIDPTTNQAGELVCPFLCPTDALNIVDKDYAAMGRLSIRELNQLRHANGATDPITVTILAWMEDAVVTVPTANDAAGLVAQAGMEKSTKSKKSRVSKKTNQSNQNNSGKLAKQDEFGSGPVSGPAGTLARIAGMLETAPIIGPYAKATQIAASGVSNVAKLFGYSRPPTLSPDSVVANRQLYGMASSNLPDQTEVLALDAKQELTVDGTVVGLDSTDEMTIRNIATRESYLDQTTWTTGDSVDQVLFSVGVTPMQSQTFAPGGGAPEEYHFTACRFASQPFRYWRGTMKYRFQIVSSAYHKGRLKIQWDPFGYASQETNVQYTQIVDISDEKDFTIEVGWGHELGWLDTVKMDDTAHTIRAPSLITSNDNNCNGVLTVSVLNTLTSPSLSAGDTIEMNVFVSAGDDFEVAIPQANLIKNITYFQPDFTPQSGMEAPAIVQEDKDCTDEPSKPIQEQRLQMFANPTDVNDHNALVYHGESIKSLRSCLKRYQFVGTLPSHASTFYKETYFVTKH